MSKQKTTVIEGKHKQLISQLLASDKFLQILRLNAILEQGRLDDSLISEIMSILGIKDIGSNEKGYKQSLVSELNNPYFKINEEDDLSFKTKLETKSKEAFTAIKKAVNTEFTANNNKKFNDFSQNPEFSKAIEYITGKKSFDKGDKSDEQKARTFVKSFSPFVGIQDNKNEFTLASKFINQAIIKEKKKNIVKEVADNTSSKEKLIKKVSGKPDTNNIKISDVTSLQRSVDIEKALKKIENDDPLFESLNVMGSNEKQKMIETLKEVIPGYGASVWYKRAERAENNEEGFWGATARIYNTLGDNNTLNSMMKYCHDGVGAGREVEITLREDNEKLGLKKNDKIIISPTFYHPLSVDKQTRYKEAIHILENPDLDDHKNRIFIKQQIESNGKVELGDRVKLEVFLTKNQNAEENNNKKVDNIRGLLPKEDDKVKLKNDFSIYQKTKDGVQKIQDSVKTVALETLYKTDYIVRAENKSL